MCFISLTFLVTRSVPCWRKRSCFMTILEIFPHQVKNIIFAWRGACEVTSTHMRWDWNEHQNEHTGQGAIPYLVTHPYLVSHPPIWYPIPDRGNPLGRTGWHETTLTSHQSGILHSLIFFYLLKLDKPLFFLFVMNHCKNWNLFKDINGSEWNFALLDVR